MQREFKTLFVALGASLLFSACASTPEECDPRQDQGFFGKIGCTVTGSYEQRIEDKEQNIESLKAENARLNQLVRDIQAKDSELLGSYVQRQRELDKIRGELYSLQSNLEDKKALDKQLQSKLDAANQQLTQMKNSPSSATLAEKKKQIEDLQATLDELSQQMMNSGI